MQCPACKTELPVGSRFCTACGNPVSGGGKPTGSSSDKWIIGIVLGLVGLVAAFFFVGIVAAIAIPNLLNAIDRGKQKRTMADIRSIGQALEAHAVAHDAYPAAETIDELRRRLEPDFIRSVPVRDGWGHEFRALSTPQGYRLISAGKDGVFQGCGGGTTTAFDADICFADGQFVQWPEGIQR